MRAVWLGIAHAVGAVFRGIGQGAKNLDPAHRKDGVALLLLGLALIVAAGTWSNLRGPVGDLVEILVTGAFGRLDLLVPILLAVIAVRFIRHPEKPEANGRIVIGLSALVIGVLGQVHIACGSPARSDGMQAIRDAGGLIGWGAATPLTYTMGEVLAVPLLVLLTVFGLLVVTATPVNAIPQRLRLLGVRLGIVHDPAEDELARGRRALRRPVARGAARAPASGAARPPTAYDPDRRGAGGPLAASGRPRRSAVPQPDMDRPMDAVDVAAAAAAALDGAVLHGMPPSPLVADLTQGVSVADREEATPTPTPVPKPAAARAPSRRSSSGGRRRPHQGRARRAPRPARRAPSSSSCPATSPTALPSLDLLSAAAPASPAAPRTTPSSPRSRTSSPSSRSTPPSPASRAGRRSRATRSSSAPP